MSSKIETQVSFETCVYNQIKVCVPECVCVYTYQHTEVCGRQKRVLDPLQLKIQVVVGVEN